MRKNEILYQGGCLNLSDHTTLKRIELKKGFVEIPEDWVILESFSDPLDCLYAGVFYCYLNPIPQDGWVSKNYVFFCDFEKGCDFPEGFEEKIFWECEKQDTFLKEVFHGEKPTFLEANMLTTLGVYL